jgi:hypothetical protein
LHPQVHSPFPPFTTSRRGKLSKTTLLQRFERLHSQRPLSRRGCEEYDAPYRSQRAFLLFLSLFLQTNPIFPCLQMAGKSTLLRMTCTAVIMAQRTSSFFPSILFLPGTDLLYVLQSAASFPPLAPASPLSTPSTPAWVPTTPSSHLPRRSRSRWTTATRSCRR